MGIEADASGGGGSRNPRWSHQLPEVFRTGVPVEKLGPVHDEAVGEQVHDPAAEAEGLHPTEALAKDDAGVRFHPKQS